MGARFFNSSKIYGCDPFGLPLDHRHNIGRCDPEFFFGGILFAVVALYAPWIIKQPFRLIEWVFMGTPLLLQLFLIYFGLVQIGIDLPAFVAGIIGLGLHFAVYNSELIQTAILAVDKAKWKPRAR